MLPAKEVIRIGTLIYGTSRFKRAMAHDLGVASATVFYACENGASDRKGFLTALQGLVERKASELHDRATKLERIRWDV